jgi:hypothetical protein
LNLEAFNEKEHRGSIAWHLHLLSLVKVIHLEALLSGLGNEPLISELVTSNATTDDILESLCFESRWKLKQ